ncbi:MAG TPA: Na(+)/H(+) antiporter subunit C [Microlunatus sp.]|jgi:multicomponent Na+:H+ antiporter subunit C|nr:Na(+)/H(+) antiporter subunit C [Microlunatus sp.]
MSSSLTLLVVSGVLISAGVYLMMERSLTRILVGVLMAGNGVNLLFLVASGVPAGAPFIDTDRGRDISDPLPQAMVLTAIVITLGLTAFLLTMAYRSFQLHGHDEVADDVEDRQIVRLAEADLASASYDEDDKSMPSEDDSDPDPAEEGSAEQLAADQAERQQRDAAEDATDRIISGEGRPGS